MNRKLWIKRVSLVLLIGMVVTSLFIALNLYPIHYNTANVYAQGFLSGSPTASLQTTQQSGLETINIFDPTIFAGIITAIGTIVAAAVAAIIAVFLENKGKGEAAKPPAGPETSRRRERYPNTAQQQKLSIGLYHSIEDAQIFELDVPLIVPDVYVPAKVTQRFSSYPDFSQYTGAAFRNVNTFLQEQLVLVQKRFDDAEDLYNVLIPSTTVAPRCLLAGDTGIGKTMQLKHYALEYAYPEEALKSMHTKRLWHNITREISDQKLPIYIELKEFAEAQIANEELDLVDFIVQKWEETYKLKGLQKYIDDKLENGQAIFLLDGLDEAFIGDEPRKTYDLVMETISNQGKRYNNVPIIVSTRSSHYQFYKEQGLYLKNAGFSTWELLGFRAEDVATYVKKWCQCPGTYLNPTDADSIIDNLKKNLRIQTLATNPLFLIHIMTHLRHSDWNLPDQRIDLYKKGTEIFLEKWDKHRQINRVMPILVVNNSQPTPPQTRSSIEKKCMVLENVAWLLHERAQYHLQEEEMIEYFKNIAEARQSVFSLSILQEIVEDGLLKKHEEVYYFFCMPLQEYFAARNAKNDKKAGAALKKYRNDPWWEEVISVHDKLR